MPGSSRSASRPLSGLGAYLLFALTIFGEHRPDSGDRAGRRVRRAVSRSRPRFVVFRLRGAYFAIGTWVMAEVYRLVLAQFKQLGGGTGTSLPPAVTNGVFGIEWVQDAVRRAHARRARHHHLLDRARCWSSAPSLAVYWILRSRRGLALAAIRDSEAAAESVGVDNFRTKFWVYVLAAVGTGMVGALIYLQKARISPDAAFSVLDWTAYVDLHRGDRRHRHHRGADRRRDRVLSDADLPRRATAPGT